MNENLRSQPENVENIKQLHESATPMLRCDWPVCFRDVGKVQFHIHNCTKARSLPSASVLLDILILLKNLPCGNV